MAFGDYGALLPTEANYLMPDQAVTSAKVEAFKRANWLSNMDRFYAELEQSMTQFQEGMSLQRDQFDWNKEQDLWERGFKDRQLSQTGRYQSGQLSLANREVDLKEEGLELEKGAQEFNMGQELWKREAYGKESERSYGLARHDREMDSTPGDILANWGSDQPIQQDSGGQGYGSYTLERDDYDTVYNAY